MSGGSWKYVASCFMAYLSNRFYVTANATTINILPFYIIEIKEKQTGKCGRQCVNILIDDHRIFLWIKFAPFVAKSCV